MTVIGDNARACIKLRRPGTRAARTPSQSSKLLLQHLLLVRVEFHQLVEKVAALEQRLHADILVEPVDVPEVRTDEHGLNAIGGNSDRVQKLSVGRAGLQNGQDGDTGPESGGELLDRSQDL